jgi:hypothetical protein
MTASTEDVRSLPGRKASEHAELEIGDATGGRDHTLTRTARTARGQPARTDDPCSGLARPCDGVLLGG